MQVNQHNKVYATDENSGYTSGIGSVSLEDLTDGNVKPTNVDLHRFEIQNYLGF